MDSLNVIWERDRVIRSIAATYKNRYVQPVKAEELGWNNGYITLILDDEERSPFLTQDGKPNDEFKLILKRSGWSFHFYDEDLVFLCPNNILNPIFINSEA